MLVLLSRLHREGENLLLLCLFGVLSLGSYSSYTIPNHTHKRLTSTNGLQSRRSHFVRHFKVTDLSVSFDQTDLRDPIVHFDALDTSESDVSINT